MLGTTEVLLLTAWVLLGTAGALQPDLPLPWNYQALQGPMTLHWLQRNHLKNKGRCDGGSTKEAYIVRTLKPPLR